MIRRLSVVLGLLGLHSLSVIAGGAKKGAQGSIPSSDTVTNLKGGAFAPPPAQSVKGVQARRRSDHPREAKEVDDETTSNSPSWFPSFQFKIDPSTKLKIRKFLFKDRTKLEIGADFNSQLSSWQFRAAWEDKLIGGKIGIKGREVDYTKTWMVGFSDNEMLNARLRLKFAVDMLDGRTYARFGFRTEETQSGARGGFPLETKVLLDRVGNATARREGHIFAELKGRVAVPAPNMEFRSERPRGKKLDVDLGDVAMSLDELNLLLHF
jgi:hypothetical protein